jgi:hypothetical protein
MDLLSKEMEDVLICYLSSKGISKLKSIEVHNAILVDWDSEQKHHPFHYLRYETEFYLPHPTERMLKF